jgi:hypothetical protein
VSLDNLSPEQRAVYNIIAKYGPIGGKEITERLFPGVEITKESKEWAGVRKKTARLEKLGLIAKGVDGYTCVQGVQGEPGVPGTPCTPEKVQKKLMPNKERLRREPGQDQTQAPQEPDNERKPPGASKVIEGMLMPNPVGRPTSYEPRFAWMLLEYFEQHDPYREYEKKDREGNVIDVTRVPNKPPNMARFAAMIGCHRHTLHEWATTKNPDGTLKYPEFSASYEAALSYQEAIFLEGGLVGAFPSNITAFALVNLSGYKAKIEEPEEDESRRIDFEAMEKISQKAHEEAERKHREIVEGRAERLGIRLDYTSEDEG